MEKFHIWLRVTAECHCDDLWVDVDVFPTKELASRYSDVVVEVTLPALVAMTKAGEKFGFGDVPNTPKAYEKWFAEHGKWANVIRKALGYPLFTKDSVKKK